MFLPVLVVKLTRNCSTVKVSVMMCSLCFSKLQRGFAFMVSPSFARCCEACVQPAEQTADQVV